jgi:GTP-binding protein
VRLLCHTVIGYEPLKENSGRNKGSLISGKGKAIPYSIDKLQDRGKFFVEPNAEIYEGQVIGKLSCDDMCVNVTKEKQSNVRSSGNDEKRIIPPIIFFRRSFRIHSK